MEIRCSIAGGEIIESGGLKRLITGIGVMNRPLVLARIASLVFHDVDFTACRPINRWKIVSEHPKRRPETGAIRQFRAKLDPAIHFGKVILALHSGGGVTGTAK